MLVVLSAPSGCGKTTIVERLMKRHPDWIRSVSCTTRPPRMGEREGSDYFFLSADEFCKSRDEGQLLESATVFDHSYGTPRKHVMEALDAGKVVVLAIDVQGAGMIRKLAGEDLPTLSVFVLPPSIKVLRERLEGRKTDPAEEIDRRIAVAQTEIKEASHYDFTVMNQNLEQTVLDIEAFIDKALKKRRKSKNAVRSS